MSLDIGEILSDWPYEPGKVTVRKIRGADGKDKIQLRLDLGLLQMETTGRPDGAQPHGHESMLAHYEHILQQHKDAHGHDKGFELDERACGLLRAEATMYYHRYLAEFVLEDYQSVVRDTMHNLRLMDLCHAYASEPSERYIQEQYRPYVLMMCTRAKAQAAMRDSRIKFALGAVKNGMEKIKNFYRRFDPSKTGKESAELAILQAMAKDIESKIPVDPLTKLRKKLQRAIDNEQYESAAALRDQIQQKTNDK